jgi:probable HAF family extracellular repeat protein
MRKMLIATLPSMCIAVFLSSLAGAQVRYSFTDLGTLGGIASYASGLNSAGDVVGASYLVGDQTFHAFLWTSSGGMQDLGSLGGDSDATSVNSSQEVTGYSYTTSGQTHAFYWSQATGMLDLGCLVANGSCGAGGINSSGQVAGSSSASDGHAHSFIWTKAGGFQDLGIPANATDSYADSIDDLGRVVGSAINGLTFEAFVWTKAGGYHLLGEFVGRGSSAAYSINDKGAVTGYADVFTDHALLPHAFLWTKRSGMQDLGTLNKGPSDTSTGFGIGLSGEIVGCDTDISDIVAIVYSKANGMQDLNTLVNAPGWTLIDAMSVNAVGQIAGDAFAGGATEHAYLLTPQ